MTQDKQIDSRLRLRAMEPEDVEMMYALENDTTLWPWGDTTAPYSRAALRDWVENTQNDAFRDGQLRLVVALDDGTTVGCADLFKIDPLNRRAEVGIALLPQYRGRNLGIMALHELCLFASRHLALCQLYAIVAEDNAAARNLFLASGFDHTATLRQWLLRTGTPQNALVMQISL